MPLQSLTAQQLRHIFPYFRHAGEEELERLLQATRLTTAKKGQLLFSPGQEIHTLDLVLSGEKRVYLTSDEGKEITLYEVGSGEFCTLNATCLLSHTPYPVYAEVVDDMDILVLRKPDFHALLTKHKLFRSFIFQGLGDAFASMTGLLNEVVFMKMRDRLFEFLLEKSENGLLRMSHKLIANNLGTAREVVSRLLKDFEREGFITLSRNTIHLQPDFFLKSSTPK